MLSRNAIVKTALMLFLLCAPPQVPAEPDTTNGTHFFFAQVTDTHLGTYRHEEALEPILEMIRTLPIPLACLVHTGDIAADNIDNTNAMARGLQLLRRVQIPVHYVAGNHDILEQRLDSTLNAYTNLCGPLCHTAEYHGVVFIFVYTEPLRTTLKVPNYSPFKWVASELRKAGQKPVIIFQHGPPVEDFHHNQWFPGWPEDLQRRWEALVNSANVKAVIAGHFHRDELHWLGKVPLYVAPPVARFYKRQPSFRIYEYRDGQIGYRTQYLEK
jgi:3',5'-cyclic AMP phosphodiesterase CpdA